MSTRLKSAVFSEDLKQKHRKNSKDFTRDRKLPFAIVVLFIVNFLKGSLQDELDQFFQALNKWDVAIREVSRSAICQARKKLSHRVFIDLLALICDLIDRHAPVQTYKGMWVLAIDGSTFRLPNQDVFYQEFDHPSPGSKHYTKLLARFSILHDVLNNVTYDAKLGSFNNGETVMADEHLKDTSLPSGSLILMDRNYVSFKLLNR